MEEMVVLVGSRMNFGNVVSGKNRDGGKVANCKDEVKRASMDHLRKLVNAEDDHMDRESMA